MSEANAKHVGKRVLSTLRVNGRDVSVRGQIIGLRKDLNRYEVMLEGPGYRVWVEPKDCAEMFERTVIETRPLD